MQRAPCRQAKKGGTLADSGEDTMREEQRPAQPQTVEQQSAKADLGALVQHGARTLGHVAFSRALSHSTPLHGER